MKIKFITLLIILSIILVYIASNLSKNDSNTTQREYKPNHASHSLTDGVKLSTTDPDSLWVIVNKKNPLPKDFEPKNLSNISDIKTINVDEAQLRRQVLTPLNEMIKSANNDRLKIIIISGYRSYNLQSIIYNANVAKDGQDKADATSARPGYSEHQTGLAVDVGGANRKCELKECFGTTDEGKWLIQNAYKYGFVIRYQKDTQKITGYSYEPWHLRYVGKQLARALQTTNLTIEEYFDYPPAEDY